MKKIFQISIVFILILSLFSLCSCGYEYFDLELDADYTNNLQGTVLNVYNWGEYISDGSEGTIDVNKEFEKITGIKVNYSTFESNETMYSQLRTAGVSYDLIIPSDYMIDRMISEEMLLPIDVNRISNYKNVDEAYKNLYFDPENKYSVPYNVGMVGIIYNTKMVDEIPDSWSVFWDSKYKNQTLMFSNPRDAFMTAQFLSGVSVNSTNKADWDKAADLLKSQKSNLQSYVMDEVYGKMETGEAAIAPYYSGDYLTMYDVNPDLAFVYPKEGTNIFVDSVCIPKCCQNYEAAMLYINFLLEPEIALANAEYIGYASPNTAVINNTDYCYYGNEILYPKEENMPKTEYYRNLSDDIRYYYENLWIDVKLY
ncbi:MAG: spermidine/putrescine ABC transporter substrate-binding protein [Ruminococcaceae bacterium]|nr:spermidine/putrescine ABC transporter substrate-binding protein [Oscillospiraceae bacterium]